jgi:hypothetical protein
MPQYKYHCDFCNRDTYKNNRIIKHTSKIKCECGHEAFQVFDIPTVITDITPFVTEHITGKAIEVTSRANRRELLRRHDLYEAG